MSKIDLSTQQIIFLVNVLNATPFRLGDAAVAIDIFKLLTPYIPKDSATIGKEKNGLSN